MKDVVISLFEKIGIDVTIIGGCCGYPLEKIGRNVELNTIKKLREKEIQNLIFACPNGMLAFKEYRPLHISQFISSLDIELLRNSKKYIYHDSAFLGRYLNVYEEPRTIIKRIGKLEEFNENRGNARWCGGEIEFKIAFPEESKELANFLVKEAKEKNAIVVTASPHCYSNLNESECDYVIDILQLIEENIK
jgi:Fe-S oxidoreductase